MTRRKWTLTIVVLIFLLLASGIGWRISARSHITAANFERVEIGMTEAEVENLLGGPADEFAYECFLGGFPTSDGVGGKWFGNDVTIHVSFHNDKVAMKWLKSPGTEPSSEHFIWSAKHRLLRYMGI